MLPELGPRDPRLHRADADPVGAEPARDEPARHERAPAAPAAWPTALDRPVAPNPAAPGPRMRAPGLGGPALGGPGRGAGPVGPVPRPPEHDFQRNGAEQNGTEQNGTAHSGVDRNGVDRSATAPQLRRFIKSRAYVPMHELRRRFAIDGGDDDVTAVEVERQRVYVGLPEREGRLLAELLKGGDIGVELSLDPIAPIVVGVYPMRPVPRT
jgi:hypothetical protein